MEIIKLLQGSNEWHDYRKWPTRNASDAAAMMGLSPYISRSELIRQKATGADLLVSKKLQQTFDKGHAAEDSARTIIEKMIDDELYPVVVRDTICGVTYSASLDGLTMDHKLAFEHKLWNKTLADKVSKNELPEGYWPQCQQILMLTQSEKLIFVVSDGTEGKMVWMSIYPDEHKIDRLIAGWEIFENDVKNYIGEIYE